MAQLDAGDQCATHFCNVCCTVMAGTKKNECVTKCEAAYSPESPPADMFDKCFNFPDDFKMAERLNDCEQCCKDLKAGDSNNPMVEKA